jgi:hypothetical protein
MVEPRQPDVGKTTLMDCRIDGARTTLVPIHPDEVRRSVSGEDRPIFAIRRMQERRESLRYPCELDAFCQPAALGPAAPCWCVAKVRNISRTGVRLLVRAQLEANTRLTVGMVLRVPGLQRTLAAEVVHRAPLRYGGWMLGCRFVNPLRGDQVRSLLLRAPVAAHR